MLRMLALGLALLCTSRFGSPPQARAEDYPSHPIVIIVGLAAGGVSDVMTRFYADVVSRKIGQKIQIENRPQGSGVVAAAALQSATPDGYTLMVFPIAQYAGMPAMEKNVSYDPVKGNQPITPLFSIASLIVVPADSPANSLKRSCRIIEEKSRWLVIRYAWAWHAGAHVGCKAHGRHQSSCSIRSLSRRGADDQ